MKPLPQGSYMVRPFKVYKSNMESVTYGTSSNSAYITIDEATIPPVGWQWAGAAEPLNSGSGIYKSPLHTVLKQVFYPTGNRITPQFNRGTTLEAAVSGSYVVGISSRAFGEQIRPGTFVLTTPAGTGSILDDGLGKLYCSTTGTGSIIGNIFYSSGIAVVNKMFTLGSMTGSVLSHEGMYLKDGNSVQVHYKSQVTLYEHTVVCTLEKGEFNVPSNASLLSRNAASSSMLIAALSSGSLTPYITTFGLYNNERIMVATAKLPRALKRIPTLDQSFIIKFDI